MQRIIKQQLSNDDQWQLLSEVTSAFLPEQGVDYILPVEYWQTQAPEFAGFSRIPAVWLEADIELEPLAEVFAAVSLVAVEFPAFMDGSGFSTGSLIREMFSYKGELRAFGSLLSDQLGYLRRCGYDSVALPDDQDIDTALLQFNAEDVSYQGDVLSPTTPFRHRTVRR